MKKQRWYLYVLLTIAYVFLIPLTVSAAGYRTCVPVDQFEDGKKYGELSVTVKDSYYEGYLCYKVKVKKLGSVTIETDAFYFYHSCGDDYFIDAYDAEKEDININAVTNGSTIYIAAEDYCTRRVDLYKGNLKTGKVKYLTRLTKGQSSDELFLSALNNKLYFLNSYGTLYSFDLKTEKVKKAAKFSGDVLSGRYCVSLGSRYDLSIRVYDIKTGKIVRYPVNDDNYDGYEDYYLRNDVLIITNGSWHPRYGSGSATEHRPFLRLDLKSGKLTKHEFTYGSNDECADFYPSDRYAYFYHYNSRKVYLYKYDFVTKKSKKVWTGSKRALTNKNAISYFERGY